MAQALIAEDESASEKALHTITETAGMQASREQFRLVVTRYKLACDSIVKGPVVEIACGTGIGLGILGRQFHNIIGIDIDPTNVAVARATYANRSRIRIEAGNAQSLPLPNASCSGAICFESLYYFDNQPQAFQEMARVLAPGGMLVICVVNPQWSGFIRSRFATTYPLPQDLAAMATNAGLKVKQLLSGCPDSDGIRQRVMRGCRKIASALGVMPSGLAARGRLKAFMGAVHPLPAELSDSFDGFAPFPLWDYRVFPNKRGKVMYLVARKEHRP